MVTAAFVARDATGSSGLLLALIGVGAIASGVFYGPPSPTTPVAKQLTRWRLVLASGTAPLALASNAAVLGVLLIIAGLAVGPASTCQFNRIGGLAPAGSPTESFTWLFSDALGGAALGNYLTGASVEQLGAQTALAVPFLLVVLATALAFGLSRTHATTA